MLELNILTVRDDVEWGILSEGEFYQVDGEPDMVRVKMSPSGANNAIRLPDGAAQAQANTDLVKPLDVVLTAQPVIE